MTQLHSQSQSQSQFMDVLQGLRDPACSVLYAQEACAVMKKDVCAGLDPAIALDALSSIVPRFGEEILGSIVTAGEAAVIASAPCCVGAVERFCGAVSREAGTKTFTVTVCNFVSKMLREMPWSRRTWIAAGCADNIGTALERDVQSLTREQYCRLKVLHLLCAEAAMQVSMRVLDLVETLLQVADVADEHPQEFLQLDFWQRVSHGDIAHMARQLATVLSIEIARRLAQVQLHMDCFDMARELVVMLTRCPKALLSCMSDMERKAVCTRLVWVACVETQNQIPLDLADLLVPCMHVSVVVELMVAVFTACLPTATPTATAMPGEDCDCVICCQAVADLRVACCGKQAVCAACLAKHFMRMREHVTCPFCRAPCVFRKNN